MDRRTVLALVLVALVILLTPKLFPTAPRVLPSVDSSAVVDSLRQPNDNTPPVIGGAPIATAQQDTGVLRVPAETLHVADILEGLDYAHRRTVPGEAGEPAKPLGLVHRDVSPSNVLISYEGEVKLCDFGIAHANDLVRGESRFDRRLIGGRINLQIAVEEQIAHQGNRQPRELVEDGAKSGLRNHAK